MAKLEESKNKKIKDKPLTRIAVLVSGGGTNLQALIDAEKSGIIRSGSIELVVSNKKDAYALERAKKAGIKTAAFTAKELGGLEAFEARLIETLNAEPISYTFMKMLPS